MIARMLNLYRGILWHAISEEEKRNIEKIFGSETKIKVARNLVDYYSGNITHEKKLDKKKGELKIIFVSRIHPKKNLSKAIEIIGQLKGQIQFHIFGPLEDNHYWASCQNEIKKMPPSINVMYKGSLKHKQIMDVYKYYHVFFLPTLGENYGHVIHEALIGGCPVVISDQTPWRNMDKLSAGWDISLAQEEKFVNVLQFYVDMNQEQYNDASRKAFEHGNTVSCIDIDVRKTLNLFLDAT
jgi:glycosyltransferase involved in cell wall biosynthesis